MNLVFFIHPRNLPYISSFTSNQFRLYNMKPINLTLGIFRFMRQFKNAKQLTRNKPNCQLYPNKMKRRRNKQDRLGFDCIVISPRKCTPGPKCPCINYLNTKCNARSGIGMYYRIIIRPSGYYHQVSAWSLTCRNEIRLGS